MNEKEFRWRRLKIIFSNFNANFSNFLILLLIFYFLFSVGRSIFSSYQDRKSIEEKKIEISELRKQVTFLENQNLYFQTQSFREKEARKKLGMIKPGENVVALERGGSGDSSTVIRNKTEIKEPNIYKWWRYFFG